MRAFRLSVFALAAVTLAGCASDFGGSVSGGKDALSPEERRLQAVETRVGQLARRLDAVNLNELDQDGQRLRDDMRALRGEVEKLRYDLDRAVARDRDIEARLARLEGGAVALVPGSVTSAAPPPAATVPAAPPAAAAAPAPARPATSAAPAAAASVPQAVAPTVGVGLPTATISQGSGVSAEEERMYYAAFDLLQNGKYDDALKGFRAQLEKWPSGKYADAALRWSGESYIIKGDYKSALTAFQTILQRFPQSTQAPEAMLKVGLTQMDMKQEAEGRATLQRVIKTYPNSTAAKAAQQRLEPAKR